MKPATIVIMIGNKILVNLDTPEAWYVIRIRRSAFVVTILIAIGWIIGTRAMYE